MTRRQWLTGLLAGGLLEGVAPIARAARQKIQDIRIVRLRVEKPIGSLEPAWNPGGKMEFAIGGGAFVEVRTDQGIAGIGPAPDADLIPSLKAQLLGKDPFDVEQHIGRLRYYVRGHAYRGWEGVDIALWDIIGKTAGQPLYKLWGAAKEAVPAYASMVQLGTPEERARVAEQVAAEGWTAMKLRLHHPEMRDDIRTIEAVRKAVGDRLELMTDANQAQSSGDWQPGVQWDFRRAVDTARELERLRCYWLEEPLPRYAFDQLAELNRLVTIPLAGGENSRGLHEFRWMLEQGVYDILQPEIMAAEGITGLRKVGALAEMFGRRVVPHHGGRGLGTLAHLHLVCSWRNAPYLELLQDPPVGDFRNDFAIFENPPKLEKDGTIRPPQAPGLGVSIRKDLISND